MSPAIGVKNRVIADQAASDGEVEGVSDQLGAHVVGHRVPDDLAVVQVDHRDRVEPPLRRGQVGDVPDQPPSRRRAVKFRPIRPGIGAATASGLVSDLRRLRVSPTTSRSRMTRPTRLWFTRRPRRRSATTIRGRP
ncbi:hypothetical protein JOF41_000905 [Saccharothrix coeruleofusca]|nr:hypothetical protein [Saccharothrix coeruleofusca]